MPIEPERWLLGTRVVDTDGRRPGRIAAACCTVDRSTTGWPARRQSGPRRRFRAVPADEGGGGNAIQTPLRTAYRRAHAPATRAGDEGSLGRTAGRDPIAAFDTSRYREPSC